MELDGFFLLFAEADPERRAAAVDRLARFWAAPDLDAASREAVEAALTGVAHDPDAGVRRRLAEVLSAMPGAPGHLIETLLADEPETAAIVAGRSPDLIDAELADLVGRAAPEVRIAVAERSVVGPSVALALAAAADRTELVALLANPGAALPLEALETAVERFGDHADVRELLMNRPDVPIAIRHRVLEKVAEAIGRQMVGNAVGDAIDDERLAEATRDTCERATVALSARAAPGEAIALVEHLRATGRLTTRLVLRAACVGDLRFVEAALAAIVGLPAPRVAALLGEGRRASLLALHRRAGMPERAFPAFAAAIEEHRRLMRETGGWDGLPGDRARFARRLVERVLTRIRDEDLQLGDDLILLLRRFAADAARDHMRAVTVAASARLLPAPPVEEVAEAPVEAAAEAAPVRDVGAEISMEAFEADLWQADVLAGTATPAEIEAEAEVAPMAVPEPETDPAVVGLFDLAAPEDFPPEWLDDGEPSFDFSGFRLRAA